MKLFRVNIVTYYYGTVRYNVLVNAKDEEDARQYIWQWPKYRNDEDAKIESVEELDLSKSGIIE